MMKVEAKDIALIRDMFAQMQTREDFLDVFNAARKVLYGADVAPIYIGKLMYFVNSGVKNSSYVTFHIKKKSGALRQINAPNEQLKSMQKTLSFILQCVFTPHVSANGFVWNKNIVNNAREHEGQRYVYNIDLKDFFESIDQARIWKCLQLPPFNLNLKSTEEIELINYHYQITSSTKLRLKPVIFKSGQYSTIKIKGKRYYLADMKSALPLVEDKNKNIRLNNPGNQILSAREFSLKYDLTQVVKELRFNENGYPFITFIDSKNKAYNIYFSKKSAHTFQKGMPLKEVFKDLEIIIQRDESGKETFKLKRQSIDEEMVVSKNQEPIWLINRDPSFSRINIASMIAAICCAELEVERKNSLGAWEKVKRNVLPQGAPTSPVLTNIVCQRLDYILSGVAKRFGLKYTRYADDITFSSQHNVYQDGSDFLKELHRIIAEQGFDIKESKTRLQKEGFRKEVTGLTVNEKVNVQRRYIKQIRMWLYLWERYGYNRASAFFIQHYFVDKGHIKTETPALKNVLAGKLEYLKMVKGPDNGLYKNLMNRFAKLNGKSLNQSDNQHHLSNVLELIFDRGLDAAMNFYRPFNS